MSSLLKFAWRLAAPALLLCASFAGHAQQAEIEQARSLLKRGDSARAYEVLAAREFDYAGNIDFDYVLGIAALEAGRADRATLALERVLAAQPDFAGARLDIARAYYALGDLQRARSEFETVQAQNPPPAARTTIARYLAAIDERSRARPATRLAGHLEGSLGRDSNINNATAQGQIYVPLFDVTFNLSASGLKTSANYAAVGGGASIEHALTERFSLFAGADARHRMHDHARSFDNSNIDARIGIQYATAAYTVRSTLAFNQYRLDDTRNRDTHGLTLEYQRRIDLANQMSAYAVHNRTRYPDPLLQSNDVNLGLAGIGWLHSLSGTTGTHIGATVFGGQEHEVEQRVDGDRKLYGTRLSAQTALRDDLDAYVSAGVQRGDYKRSNIVFGTTRRDETYDVVIGAIWRFRRDWSLRPAYVYARNDSNLSINDYDRHDITLTLRRDF